MQPGLTLPPNLPTLTLSKVAGNQAVLQWQGGTNFILETASSLKPDALWVLVTNVPLTVDGHTFNVTLPVTNATQFFRLRAH